MARPGSGNTCSHLELQSAKLPGRGRHTTPGLQEERHKAGGSGWLVGQTGTSEEVSISETLFIRSQDVRSLRKVHDGGGYARAEARVSESNVL